MYSILIICFKYGILLKKYVTNTVQKVVKKMKKYIASDYIILIFLFNKIGLMALSYKFLILLGKSSLDFYIQNYLFLIITGILLFDIFSFWLIKKINKKSKNNITLLIATIIFNTSLWLINFKNPSTLLLIFCIWSVGFISICFIEGRSDD